MSGRHNCPVRERSHTSIPLITVKPYLPSAAGDAVGSPLLLRKYGPVTTDLEKREAVITAAKANLRSQQYAGPRAIEVKA